MMVSEIKGFGAQSGHTEIYRGAEYINFVPKIRINWSSKRRKPVTLSKQSPTRRTGKIGDGKIFVLDVEQTIRVRTGETGGRNLEGQRP